MCWKGEILVKLGKENNSHWKYSSVINSGYHLECENPIEIKQSERRRYTKWKFVMEYC